MPNSRVAAPANTKWIMNKIIRCFRRPPATACTRPLQGGIFRRMRINRNLISVFALVLVFQCAVAVLPHEHGCGVERPGDALAVAATLDGHHGCLACTAQVPAAISPRSTNALDAAAFRSVVVAVGECGAAFTENGAFDPRGPPAVV